jgi:hypothetical protein
MYNPVGSLIACDPDSEAGRALERARRQQREAELDARIRRAELLATQPRPGWAGRLGKLRDRLIRLVSASQIMRDTMADVVDAKAWPPPGRLNYRAPDGNAISTREELDARGARPGEHHVWLTYDMFHRSDRFFRAALAATEIAVDESAADLDRFDSSLFNRTSVSIKRDLFSLASAIPDPAHHGHCPPCDSYVESAFENLFARIAGWSDALRTLLPHGYQTADDEAASDTAPGAETADREQAPTPLAPRGRSNQPKAADVQALFNRVAELPAGQAMPAPDIFKALRMTRQFLSNHKNTGDAKSWNENRLDVLGHGEHRAHLISRESILRWLGRAYLGGDDHTLESLGALPALKPASEAKAS